MLARAHFPVSVGMWISDCALLGGLFYAIHFVKDSRLGGWLGLAPWPSTEICAPWVGLVVLTFTFSFWLMGFYGPTLRTATTGVFLRRTMAAIGVAFLISSAATLFAANRELSRGLLLLGFGLAVPAFAAQRIAVRASLKFVRRHGRNVRHIIIIGSGRQAAKVVSLIQEHAGWGFRIEGYIDTGEPKGDLPVSLPCLGVVEDVGRVLDERVVDRVFIAVPGSVLAKYESVVKRCEELGIRVHVAADLFENVLSEARVEQMNGQPILTFERVHHALAALAVKRLLDAVVAAIALIVLSPLFLLIALLVKLTSRGPVFFVQERAGRNGRRFRFYKFRSMVEGAEEKREELLHLNEVDGPAFKVTNDPRVTLFGRLLRRFSLDELPQFWNVLRGDMSLVGPRPLPVEEAGACKRWQKRRLSMRPGLTCLWQINGRSSIHKFDEWARLDLKYIDRWSLRLDLYILLRTVPVVVLGRGAH